jgi:hypothetical protein
MLPNDRGCTRVGLLVSFVCSVFAVWILGLLCEASLISSNSIDRKRSANRISSRESVGSSEEKSRLAGDAFRVAEGKEVVELSHGLAALAVSGANQRLGSVRQSGVPVDPVVVLPKDAPKMPSSPSGAVTIRFSSWKVPSEVPRGSSGLEK